MAIFIIMELNHKTRQWVAIENTSQQATATSRLATLRSQNECCDYKVEWIPEVPT